QQLLETAAQREGISDTYEVSLTFVDDETIRDLNHSYRGINQPTDVLSFALEERQDELVTTKTEEGPPRMLGDIVISVPKAMEQAADYNHSLLRELGFLAVHGFLHLCGYDHAIKKDERQM